MRLFKVFLSAVIFFAFLNAQAQLITGAYGYKLGQHIPSCKPRYYDSKEECKAIEINDTFFDRLEINHTPESKLIYSIEVIKDVVNLHREPCGKSDEYMYVYDILKKKYGKLEQYSGRFREGDLYTGRTIYLSHCSDLSVEYLDEDLKHQAKLERERVSKSEEERRKQIQNKEIEKLKARGDL